MLGKKVYDQSTIQLDPLERVSDPAPTSFEKRASDVQASISKLEDEYSQVIVLRHFEHLPNRKISQILDISESAASIRYLRAIRRLRKLVRASDSSQSTVNRN